MRLRKLRNCVSGVRNMMVQSDDPAKTLEMYLDSMMAIEFIRVEDDDELVIIGLD